MRNAMIAFAASLSLAMPAAPALSFTMVQDAEEKAEDPNDRICKRFAQSGTRVKKRVCHPRYVWEQMEQDAEEMGRKILIEGGVNPNANQTSAVQGGG